MDVYNISWRSCDGVNVKECKRIDRTGNLPQAVVVIMRVRARVSRQLLLFLKECVERRCVVVGVKDHVVATTNKLDAHRSRWDVDTDALLCVEPIARTQGVLAVDVCVEQGFRG